MLDSGVVTGEGCSGAGGWVQPAAPRSRVLGSGDWSDHPPESILSIHVSGFARRLDPFRNEIGPALVVEGRARG